MVWTRKTFKCGNCGCPSIKCQFDLSFMSSVLGVLVFHHIPKEPGFSFTSLLGSPCSEIPIHKAKQNLGSLSHHSAAWQIISIRQFPEKKNPSISIHIPKPTNPCNKTATPNPQAPPEEFLHRNTATVQQGRRLDRPRWPRAAGCQQVAQGDLWGGGADDVRGALKSPDISGT